MDVIDFPGPGRYFSPDLSLIHMFHLKLNKNYENESFFRLRTAYFFM